LEIFDGQHGAAIARGVAAWAALACGLGPLAADRTGRAVQAAGPPRLARRRAQLRAPEPERDGAGSDRERKPAGIVYRCVDVAAGDGVADPE